MPQTTNPWRARIDRSKADTRQKSATWRTSVDYRKCKPFTTASDTDRIALSIDWARTKGKIASLFGQVPSVVLTPKRPQSASAVPVFAKALNETLQDADIGSVINEILADVVNAAGFGAAIASYEASTATVKVPAIDPATLSPDQQLALALGTFKMPMVDVEQIVDRQFSISRMSPWDLLRPTDFTGSNFNKAPWLGRTGRTTWAKAQIAFKLADADRELVTGKGRVTDDRPDNDVTDRDEDVVEFDELFYWRKLYHSEEKYYKAIHHLVFVNGKDEPVINEPWKGQQFNEETGDYVGACRNPIQVVTLAYISDESIPPSDSEIGRSQVDELMKSRAQVLEQREHSKPLRWFDPSRCDPTTIDQLMRGTFQGIIPLRGGASAIGEVSRAVYPRESFEFDSIANRDLDRAWGSGANQNGTFASGERSASEANIVQSNYQSNIGADRDKVTMFFLALAEVTAGFLALYGDFELPAIDEGDAQRIKSWDRTRINGECVYTIRKDSTVLLSADQQIQRLTNFWNFGAKTGYLPPEQTLKELAALSGLDPDRFVQAPQPKGPDKPNISFRFKGEDLRDPANLAILVAAGLAPKPEEVEAAKKIRMASIAPPSPPQPAPPSMPAGTNPQIETPPGELEMADRLNRRRAQ